MREAITHNQCIDKLHIREKNNNNELYLPNAQSLHSDLGFDLLSDPNKDC